MTLTHVIRKYGVPLLLVASAICSVWYFTHLAWAAQSSTTARPNSTVSGGWTAAGTADSSCTGNCMRVDEALTGGNGNGNTDYVQAQAAASDEYNMQDTNGNAQRASNITLRVYMTRQSSESCSGLGAGTPQNVPLVIGIRLNGGSLQTANKTVGGTNGTYAWYTQDFAGTYTQADINTLTTYISKGVAPSCAGLFGSMTQAVFRVSTVEAVVTWETPDFNQSVARVYQNQNDIQPSASLATTNALADIPQSSQFRVRMGVLNGYTDWLTGSWGDHNNQYKLQYAQRSAASCSAQVSGWGDVTGATPIRYFNNASIADGQAISANGDDPDTGGSTKIYQTYEEANPISLSNGVSVGQTAVWDFSLTDSGSVPGTIYCLRIVESDGTTLGTYGGYGSVVVTGSLDVDVVTAGGATVASPNMPFGSVLVVDSCQQATGSLGLASQVIRVTNNIATNGWSLSLAATSGPTAFWSNGSTGSYDYNDSAGSPNGCSDGGDADNRAGRLTVSPNTGSLTPQSGCSGTGTSLGTSTSFAEGSVNSITLATASSATPRFCYFSLTGAGLSQQIPEWRPKGSYSLDFTLTVLAL